MKNQDNQQKKRAVIYARYSSHMQRGESITAQVRACRIFADQYGYDVVGIYTDKAKSAKNSDRPEFQKMILASNSGAFDIVLVHKYNRFSRNIDDDRYFENQLKDNGVRLISVMEQVDNTPAGNLVRTIISAVNQYEIENLGLEVQKGHRENAYEGKSTGGTPPLGYDIGPDLKYKINEREAAAVRIIFEMYDTNHGYSEIVDVLDNMGVKSKRGQKIGRNSLHDILINEKYTGVMVYNKAVAANSKGKRNGHKYKDDSQITRVEGAIPAIIKKDLFERVQKKMSNQRHLNGAKKAKIPYMLSGIIFCGECGAPMVGDTHRYRGYTYSYYQCTCRKNNKSCNKTPVRKDIIEDLVIHFLSDYVFNDEHLKIIAEDIYKMQQNYTSDIPSEINQLTKEMEQIQKKIDNIISAIADGYNAVELKERLNSLADTKKILGEKIRLAKSTKEIYSKSLESIEKWILHCQNIRTMPPDEQANIIKMFVSAIYVSDNNKVGIALYFGDEDDKKGRQITGDLFRIWMAEKDCPHSSRKYMIANVNNALIILYFLSLK